MIFHIEGPAGSGKSSIANAIRNGRIATDPTNGALIVDEKCEGEPVHLLEKLIKGDPLTPGTAAGKVKWKNDPTIIFVGKQIAMLDEFEELAPGVTAKLGPIRKVTISAAKK